jgi:hypothetical protein
MEMEKKLLLCAQRFADWYCRNTADDGSTPFMIYTEDRRIEPAYEWSTAFAFMGMISAYKVFGNSEYEQTAAKMLKYLKSLQIMDTASPHYGAFRERTPETNWCYVRDGLSAAWAMIEAADIYGDKECLDRAVLWAEWFMRHGIDETGWPYWGLFFDLDKGIDKDVQMCNDIHGCFHGGSLNFFYHLYRATGDRRWVGDFFEHMADYFVSTIQQQDGFFRSVEKATGNPPPADPQSGLHRANDDLGTLGLLCASQIYPKQSYSMAISKFLDAVFSRQNADGSFESSCASVPVVLNIARESGYHIPEKAEERAWDFLFSRQFPDGDPSFAGGLNESDLGYLCIRSMSYALIVITKIIGNNTRFLSIN